VSGYCVLCWIWWRRLFFLCFWILPAGCKVSSMSWNAAKALTIIGLILLVSLIIFRLVKTGSKIPQDLRVTLQALQTVALFPSITTKWPKTVQSHSRIIPLVYDFPICIELTLFFVKNLNIELFSPKCAIPMTFWTKYNLKLFGPLVLGASVMSVHALHKFIQSRRGVVLTRMNSF
jgi:membrane-associated HD superfamily phosphohydrolase